MARATMSADLWNTTRLLHVQNSRNARRCQAMMVSGLTITTADRHWVQTLESQIHDNRSALGQAYTPRTRSLEHLELVSQREDLELQRRARTQ